MNTQVPYTPASKLDALGTLIPANMAAATNKALEALKAKVGDVDAFVAERLGYDVADLGDYFAAEQIDAIAFAMVNEDAGEAFIIADQTGIGKGRVNAALLLDAHRRGLVPVFVTERPDLYADISRDLHDIGAGHLKLLATNHGLRGQKAIDLPDGTTLTTEPKGRHDEVLADIAAERSLGEHGDILVTTYTQMQTVKGTTTPRREVLSALAPRAVIVADESHNALGPGASKPRAKKGLPDRADFLRGLVNHGIGRNFSSATWAKRPDVMDLYATTALKHAVQDPRDLGDVIGGGGVALQQVAAAMLAETGQYMRRERDMSGIEYRIDTVEVDKRLANDFSAALSAIQRFDEIKQGAVKNKEQELARSGKAVLGDGATGIAGVESTAFTSIMHNLVSQGLLAMTAEAGAKRMVDALKAGEKPVLVVDNTMGSFIEQFARDFDLQPGQAAPVDFGDLLDRYLERSRDILVGDAYGDKQRHRLSDAELGSGAMKAYTAAKKLIAERDWTAMPVSPIDHMLWHLEQAGYAVDEITGRSHAIAYGPDGAVYRRRSGAETAKAHTVKTTDRFNQGQLDAVIINRSAATGSSMHAHELFKDKRRRHMGIFQADAVIDRHVQLLGRVDRTGQVSSPRYTQFVADIPATIRPAAVLMGNLRSLNANVQADPGSPFVNASSIDFLNPIGDRAVRLLMENDRVLHARLGRPLPVTESGRLDPTGAARKVSGRVILLPLAEQEDVYDKIFELYDEEVARAESMGETLLGAQTLDLQAVAEDRIEVESGHAEGSPFAQPIWVQTMDVRRLDRPMTWAQVQVELRHAAGLDEHADDAAFSQAIAETSKATLDELDAAFTPYLEKRLDGLSDERRADHLKTILEGDRARIARAIQLFPIGANIELMLPDGPVFGVAAGIRRRGRALNPAAQGDWEVTFLLADGSRRMHLPLSRIQLAHEKADKTLSSGRVAVHRAGSVETWLPDGTKLKGMRQIFDRAAAQTREKRRMVTGNVLAGYDRFRAGRVVFYTDASGEVRPGILLPREYELEQALERQPVSFGHVDQALEFLEEPGREVVTKDRLASVIRREKDALFELRVPAARSLGGGYFLDDQLIKAAGREFVSSGQHMVLGELTHRQAERVLARLHEISPLVATADRDAARDIAGIELPESMPTNAIAGSAMPVSTEEVPSETDVGRVLVLAGATLSAGGRIEHYGLPVAAAAPTAERPHIIAEMDGDWLMVNRKGRGEMIDAPGLVAMIEEADDIALFGSAAARAEAYRVLKPHAAAVTEIAGGVLQQKTRLKNWVIDRPAIVKDEDRPAIVKDEDRPAIARADPAPRRERARRRPSQETPSGSSEAAIDARRRRFDEIAARAGGARQGLMSAQAPDGERLVEPLFSLGRPGAVERLARFAPAERVYASDGFRAGMMPLLAKHGIRTPLTTDHDVIRFMDGLVGSERVEARDVFVAAFKKGRAEVSGIYTGQIHDTDAGADAVRYAIAATDDERIAPRFLLGAQPKELPEHLVAVPMRFNGATADLTAAGDNDDIFRRFAEPLGYETPSAFNAALADGTWTARLTDSGISAAAYIEALGIALAGSAGVTATRLSLGAEGAVDSIVQVTSDDPATLVRPAVDHDAWAMAALAAAENRVVSANRDVEASRFSVGAGRDIHRSAADLARAVSMAGNLLTRAEPRATYRLFGALGVMDGTADIYHALERIAGLPADAEPARLAEIAKRALKRHDAKAGYIHAGGRAFERAIDAALYDLPPREASRLARDVAGVPLAVDRVAEGYRALALAASAERPAVSIADIRRRVAAAYRRMGEGDRVERARRLEHGRTDTPAYSAGIPVSPFDTLMAFAKTEFGDRPYAFVDHMLEDGGATVAIVVAGQPGVRTVAQTPVFTYPGQALAWADRLNAGRGMSVEQTMAIRASAEPDGEPLPRGQYSIGEEQVLQRIGDYDHYAGHAEAHGEAMGALGWHLGEVVIATHDGARAAPAFTSSAAPAIAILPTPARMATEAATDPNAVRWRLVHAPTGTPIGNVALVLFTPEAAADMASMVAETPEWSDQLTREDLLALPPGTVQRILAAVDEAFGAVGESDGDVWRQRNVAAFSPAEAKRQGFDTANPSWLPVDDGTRPTPSRGPEISYTYGSEAMAHDLDGRDPVPVYLRIENLADLTRTPLQAEVKKVLQDIYNLNKEMLEFGILNHALDDFGWKVNYGDSESIEELVQDGEAPEDAIQRLATEAVDSFSVDDFIEAVCMGDMSMAGDYDGDLEDVIAQDMSLAGFDGMRIWSPVYGETETVVLAPSAMMFAWDMLEDSVEVNAQRHAEREQRRKAYEESRSPEELDALRMTKEEAIANFDLDRLKEAGMDTATILWASVENAEYPNLADVEAAGGDSGIPLFETRTQAEAPTGEAAPIYMRRGVVADLIAPGVRERAALAALDPSAYGFTTADAMVASIAAGRWQANGPGGGNFMEDVLTTLWNAGAHSARLKDEGNSVLIAANGEDLTIAFDVLTRDALRRRSSDIVAGPALESAVKQAALTPPRLLLPGPDGSIEEVVIRSAVERAAEIRAARGPGVAVIYLEPDGSGRMFDSDARRAAAALTDLDLVEIADAKGNDLAEVHIPAEQIEAVAQALGQVLDGGALTAAVDEQDNLILTDHHGGGTSLQVIDEAGAEALRDARTAQAERARGRKTAWSAKTPAERHADLQDLARRDEAVFMRDGKTWRIDGAAAEAVAALDERLNTNLAFTDGTASTFLEDDIATIKEIARQLKTAGGLTVMLAEEPDRRHWRTVSVDGVDGREASIAAPAAVAEAASAHALWQAARAERSENIVLSRIDGEPALVAYGDDARQLKALAPGLGDLENDIDDAGAPLVRFDMGAGKEMVAILARLTAAANVSLAIAERRMEGGAPTLFVRSFGPVAEIIDDTDRASAMPAREAEVSRSKPKPTNSSSPAPTTPPRTGDATVAPAAKPDELPPPAEPAEVTALRERRDLYRALRAQAGGPLLLTEGDRTVAFDADVAMFSKAAPRVSHYIGQASLDGVTFDGLSLPTGLASTVIEELNRAGVSVGLAQAASGTGRDRQWAIRSWPATPAVTTDGPVASTPVKSTIEVAHGPATAAPIQSVVTAGVASQADRMDSMVEETARQLIAGRPRDRGSLQQQLDNTLAALAALEPGSVGHLAVETVRSQGLLNGSLYRELAPHSSDVIPTSSGYVFYRHPDTQAFAYESIPDFLRDIGPDGPLGDGFPIAVSDILADFAGDYVSAAHETFGRDLADLKALILDMARQMNPNLEVAFVDRLFADNRSLVDGGGLSGDRSPVLGLLFQLHQLAGISTDISRGDMVNVGAHEILHSLAPLLTDREKKILKRRFPPRGGRSAEEEVASAFGQWMAEQIAAGRTVDGEARFATGDGDGPQFSTGFSNGRVETYPPAARAGSTHGTRLHASVAAAVPDDVVPADVGGAAETPAQIFGKLGRFIGRMDNAMRSHGFKTWEDVFEQLASGRVGERATVFDIAGPVKPFDAARIAKHAGLDTLARRLSAYATRNRADDDGIPGERVYRMLRRQLSDSQIISALLSAGYHAIRDDANATTLNGSRRAMALAVLDMQSRVTPLDVGPSTSRPFPAARAATRPLPVTATAAPSINPAAHTVSTPPRRRGLPVRVRASGPAERAIRLSVGAPYFQPPVYVNGRPMAESTVLAEIDALVREEKAAAEKARKARKGASRAKHKDKQRKTRAMAAEYRLALAAWRETHRPEAGSARPGNEAKKQTNIENFNAQAIMPDKRGDAFLARAAGSAASAEQENWPMQEIGVEFAHAQKVHPLANVVELMTAEPFYIPEDAIPLYVPAAEYQRLKASGTWPARSADLVFDLTTDRWFISPRHPDVESMVARFGESNKTAMREWERDQEAAETAYAMLNGAGRHLPIEQRLYLHGIERQAAHEAGAVYDRSRNGWFIDVNDPRAKSLAETYGAAGGAEVDARQAEERERAYMERVGGAAALSVGGAAPRTIEQTAPAVAAGIAAAATVGAAAGKSLAVEGGSSGEAYLSGVGDAFSNLSQANQSFDEAFAQTDVAVDQIGLAADYVTGEFKRAVTTNDSLIAEQGLQTGAEVVQGALSQLGEAAVTAAGGIAAAVKGHGLLVGASTKALIASASPAALGVTGALAGAAVVGAGFVAHRAWNKRREARLVQARTVPWTMEPGAFGQSAKAMFSIERRPETPDGHRITLKDRQTGDVVFSATSEKPISARNAIRSVHAEVVGQAMAAGLTVPENVTEAVKRETRRAATETNLRANPAALKTTVWVDPEGGEAAKREAAHSLRTEGRRIDLDTVRVATAVKLGRTGDSQPDAERLRRGLGLGIRAIEAEKQRRDLAREDGKRRGRKSTKRQGAEL